MLVRRRKVLGPVTLCVPDCTKQSDSLQWHSADVTLAGEAIAWCTECEQGLHKGS